MEGNNKLKNETMREQGGWDNWNMIELEKCDIVI